MIFIWLKPNRRTQQDAIFYYPRCDKEFYMADRVNAALEQALAEAGFVISFSTYRVDLNPGEKNADQVTPAGLGNDGK